MGEDISVPTWRVSKDSPLRIIAPTGAMDKQTRNRDRAPTCPHPLGKGASCVLVGWLRSIGLKTHCVRDVASLRMWHPRAMRQASHEGIDGILKSAGWRKHPAPCAFWARTHRACKADVKSLAAMVSMLLLPQFLTRLMDYRRH